MNIRYCCDSMNDACLQYDQRGFSAYIPDKYEIVNIEFNKRLPHIRFLICDFKNINYIKIDSDQPISLEGTIGIRYCPWCGMKLVE